MAKTEPVAVELPRGEDISRAAGQASKALQVGFSLQHFQIYWCLHSTLKVIQVCLGRVFDQKCTFGTYTLFYKECVLICMQDTTVAFSDAVQEAQLKQQTQHEEQEQEKGQEVQGSIDADLLEQWDARLRQKAAQRPDAGSQQDANG